MNGKKDLKIVFMGTPEFALPTLEALIKHYDVICAVTKPDRPKGRGNKLTPPPVKVFAQERGIPVCQPENVKTPEFTQQLREYGADLFVTCAYGKILPQSVLDLPRLGCINVHASLLPKYRGAAPLWHCVLNGEREVGVTTMFTDIGMDTGDILLKEKTEIDSDTTMGEVHDRLAEMGGRLIVRTIEALLTGTLIRIPQNDAEATYAPMVSKEDAEIDWKKTAEAIHNLVRGMNPFPVAHTKLEGAPLKIYRTRIVDESVVNQQPGMVLQSEGGILQVACGKGILEILELQAASSKRMAADAYLNGHPIPKGLVLGR